ncbi:MAG: hypothetical protein EZS28_005899 [Streblomastix strix]|uniref:OTU domain-containing protein n=1 Tax=Streblomastix strix TaxID=222440 RepID=A0A5J4WUK1_9EUKA|nr:MAG: hypothetical protein EZS28_005899 [Streblomastix strix]
MMILCSIDAYQEITTLSNRKSSFECTDLCPWSPERACASENIKDDKDKPIYPNGRIMKGHDVSFAFLVPGAPVKKSQHLGVTAKRTPSSVSYVNQLLDIGFEVRNTSNSGATVKCTLSSDKAVKNELNSGSIARKSLNAGQIRKLASTLSFEEMQEELVNHDRVLFNNRGDGNCFYMSISHQLHGTTKMHGAIRQAAVKELIENRLMYEDDFDKETLDQYARKKSQERKYADARKYFLTCRALNINLRVYFWA